MSAHEWNGNLEILNKDYTYSYRITDNGNIFSWRDVRGRISRVYRAGCCSKFQVYDAIILEIFETRCSRFEY
jgi:hypothetical protein